MAKIDVNLQGTQEKSLVMGQEEGCTSQFRRSGDLKLPKLLPLARKNHRSEELSPTLTLRGEEQRLAVTQG